MFAYVYRSHLWSFSMARKPCFVLFDVVRLGLFITMRGTTLVPLGPSITVRSTASVPLGPSITMRGTASAPLGSSITMCGTDAPFAFYKVLIGSE